MGAAGRGRLPGGPTSTGTAAQLRLLAQGPVTPGRGETEAAAKHLFHLPKPHLISQESHPLRNPGGLGRPGVTGVPSQCSALQPVADEADGGCQQQSGADATALVPRGSAGGSPLDTHVRPAWGMEATRRRGLPGCRDAVTQAGWPRAPQKPHAIPRGSAGRDGPRHLRATAGGATAAGDGPKAPTQPPASATAAAASSPAGSPTGTAAAAGDVAEEGEQQHGHPAPGVAGPHPARPAKGAQGGMVSAGILAPCTAWVGLGQPTFRISIF